MAGRNRQPIDLIAAKGRKHLTKAEYEERKKNEIEVPDDNIQAPSFLSKKEKIIFEDLSKTLVDAGVMKNTDCNALGMYIKACTNYEKAIKKLDSIKLSANKKIDVPVDDQENLNWYRWNKQHKIVIRCEKEVKQLGTPFGMDPLSRCKIQIPKTEPEKPVNKFLQKKA